MRILECRIAVWVAAVLGLAGCYPNWGYLEVGELAPGESSLGIQVHAEKKDRLDYSSGYALSLYNHDLHQGCNVALYFFDGEPNKADVPLLTAGGMAPATLPGGGRLQHEWFLPAVETGDHTFSVDLDYEYLYPERGWHPLAALHRGLVLATSGCPGLQLELNLWVEASGRVARPSDRDMRSYLRRLW